MVINLTGAKATVLTELNDAFNAAIDPLWKDKIKDVVSSALNALPDGNVRATVNSGVSGLHLSVESMP